MTDATTTTDAARAVQQASADVAPELLDSDEVRTE